MENANKDYETIKEYCSQKRIKLILDVKFELLKNIQPLLSDDENIKTVYDDFFIKLDDVIKQEARHLNSF